MHPLNHKERQDQFFYFCVAFAITITITVFSIYYTNGMLTNLARSAKEPTVAFDGTTPLVWPWRVVMAGPDKDRLIKSETLSDLDERR